MTKPLIFDDAAAHELELSAIWYERERPGLGDELLEIVAATVEAIRTGTLTAQPVPALRDPSVRRVFVERFPYAVVYFETEAVVHVVAVAHLVDLLGTGVAVSQSGRDHDLDIGASRSHSAATSTIS